MVRASHKHIGGKILRLAKKVGSFVRRVNVQTENDSKSEMSEDASLDVSMKCLSIGSSPRIPRNAQNTTSSSAEMDNVPSDESELRNELSTISDELLAVVSSALVDHDSHAAFKRRICVFDQRFRNKAEHFYRKSRQSIKTSHYCNDCAKELRNVQEKCCQNIVCSYTRMPLIDQLKDFMAENYEEIMKVREDVAAGILEGHNLNGKMFKNILSQDDKDTLNISLVTSIDGVNVIGKTRKKIWPLSSLVVDLKTESMQKAMNVLLAAILECEVNPSTQIWSKVWKMFVTDLENVNIQLAGRHVKFHVVSVTADQPAKRSLFGFKSHNGKCCCFFCTNPDGFYKRKGNDRAFRGDEVTIKDAEGGYFGFTGVFSEVLRTVKPYFTIIDLLHTTAEGIFKDIISESFSSSPNKRKTELYICDRLKLRKLLGQMKYPKIYRNCWKMRNGTAKSDLFRSLFFMSSLIEMNHSPRARIVIIGLNLLVSSFYTGIDLSKDNIQLICESLDSLYSQEYDVYFTIKLHELLFHTQVCYENFGNLAPLSTTNFETFYKYIFGETSTSLTNSFCEFAGSRFIAIVAFRRELMKRVEAKVGSPVLHSFLKSCQHWQEKTTKYSTRIRKPKSEDLINTNQKVNYYAVFRMKIGRFISKYTNPNSSDDLVFFNANSRFRCGRFVSYIVGEDQAKLLIEPVTETLHDDRFAELDYEIRQFPMHEIIPATRIIALAKSYRSISHGYFSGERLLIDESQITGVGCYIMNRTGLVGIQMNGVAAHV